uniref:Cilia and flagella associated protein 298 n=1 Tax=Myotis myotis TaxID=51298 RepID=A0A7J7ZU11_MYOMY|nr:cilia and flagella associated protein 298 [Myotis myotis]
MRGSSRWLPVEPVGMRPCCLLPPPWDELRSQQPAPRWARAGSRSWIGACDLMGCRFQKQVEAGVCVTMEMVQDALDQLRGAVMIVYPMGLPPYDPIRMEFENKEDLSGTQAALSVIAEPDAQLWWAAKELRRTKTLSDYVGRNEKTKIIVKIQQRGQGAPAREPVISSEEQKQLMLFYHRRQEELKKLEENDDDSCLNSPWADNTALKRHFQGVKDIRWRPR